MVPPPVAPQKTTVWSNLCLLLWKNSVLQKRHKFQTFFDVTLPVLIFVLLGISGIRFGHEYRMHQFELYEELEINTLSQDLPIKEKKLAFYPNCEIFEGFMINVSTKLQLEHPVGVDEENLLESTLANEGLFAAIHFHHLSNISEFPKELSYSLRFPSVLRSKTNEHPGVPTWHTNQKFKLIFLTPDLLFGSTIADDGGPPSYHKEGFLAIQNAIAREFISIFAVIGTKIPDVRVKRYPFTDSPEHYIMQFFFPFFVMSSFNYSFSNAVRFIAIEKQKQLKETMKIMGLQNWLYWLSCFLRPMTTLTISVVLITISLKIPISLFGEAVAVFPKSNAFLLFTFFFVYCVNLITQSFLVSTFISKAKSSTAVAFFSWYLSFLPFILPMDYDDVAGLLKICFCMFPNTAMAYGILLIIRSEDMGDGLNWYTMWRPLNVYDSLTIGITMTLLLLSSLIFLILAVYFESLFPGSYGVAKPWYYPFKKEFWFGSQNRRNSEPFDEHIDDNGGSQADPRNFEEDPTDECAGVVIKSLCKTYGKNTVVSNLTMNMFNNQITVLLGHNGAGKTTLYSMLTGMIPPTSGTALINGYDIRTNMDLVRSSMGFCTQHNTLFDELTVREHILFYSRLKGLSSTEANEEVKKYVRLLELEPKLNEISQNLSGGMKRKLSVGIALCGTSKVVFFDEPTSGMDVASRRSLWNVLIEEKKNRVIVLTTHSMDEADILGDRIAIMAEGSLKCVGSSSFLKKRFGPGYHLKCEKKDGCNSYLVTESLRKYLPTLQISAENESEITYELPDDQLLHQMFTELEENERKLNLNGYVVSLATMGEIFLKISKDSVHDTKSDKNSAYNNTASETISITENHFNDTLLLSGGALLRNQAMAMFKKRILCWLRSWKIFTYYNISFLIIFATITFEGFRLDLPRLNISLDTYQKPILLVQNSNWSSDILKQYQENVKTSSTNAEVETTDENLDSDLVSLAKIPWSTLNYQYLAAASAPDDSTIVAWFNNKFLHTAPLALNLVHNAMIRAIINQSHYSIHVNNAPFNSFVVHPYTTLGSTPVGDLSFFGVGVVFCVGLIMPLITSTIAMFYEQEKDCRAKFMQYVSGINLSIFWIASIFWDVLTNMTTAMFVVILLSISRNPFWSHANTLGAISLLFIMYSVAMTSVICLASLFFTEPSTAMDVVIFVLFVLEYLVPFMGDDVNSLLMIYPSWTLSNALLKVAKAERYAMKKYEHEDGHEYELLKSDLFSWGKTGIYTELLFMVVTSIGSLIILLSIEQGLFGCLISYVVRLRQRILYAAHTNVELLDDDVSDLKDRVNAMTYSEMRNQNLVLRNVSKFYGNFGAVNEVSLEIKKGECIGILGNNGAGKSSIFKMLTGEERISKGEIFVHGRNLKSDIWKVYKCMGYCPQFDALFDNLTGRETLEIFALIRGVPHNEVSEYAKQLSTDLDLTEHVDKKVSELSGGNKRKLSTAIALMGNVKVIFLDEPTAGMDPITKRNMWKIFMQLRDQGKSTVLSSHSMEECEALCTKLTVMVNGSCKCYGSAQHLKNKFTKGFELKIKVKPGAELSRLNAVKNYVANAFDGAILIDEYKNLFTYTIPTRKLKWSTVFGMMANGRKPESIEYYSVSQNSLEQVLLSFVKNQRTRNDQEEDMEHCV